MTVKHSTQSTPHPPRQPLFLSQDDIRAYYDIDNHGIKRAGLDSQLRLELLVGCLTTNVTHFIKTYRTIKPAGLLLNVDVLLPVFQEVHESEFLEEEPEDD